MGMLVDQALDEQLVGGLEAGHDKELNFGRLAGRAARGKLLHSRLLVHLHVGSQSRSRRQSWIRSLS
jgi:hypothetical protein